VEALLAADLDPATGDALSLNQDLHRSTWFTLWPAKPKITADRAENLAGRTLDADQITWVLDHDKRGRVLDALIAANELTVDQQTELLARPKLPAQAAKALREQPWLDPALKRQVL